MRATLRILFCLAAWLMLSPLAMASPQCEAQPSVKVVKHVMPCCEDGAACEMPGMQRDPLCAKCAPLVPLLIPALVPDAVPAMVLSIERPITFDCIVVYRGFVVPVQTHPPPDTLLALKTMLTC